MRSSTQSSSLLAVPTVVGNGEGDMRPSPMLVPVLW
jgi:hypothetical protein